MFKYNVVRSALSRHRTLLLVFALSLLGNLEARAAASRPARYVAAGRGSGHVAPNPPAAAETIVLAGKITNPNGPLPGAVVTAKSLRKLAVTNAAGEFELTAPANAGSLQATVTCVGYADEQMTLNPAGENSTLNFSNARLIVVSRPRPRQQYRKTARKQGQKDRKQIHK